VSLIKNNNLNEQSIERSIIKDPTGGYIFVSGKNIGSMFFTVYNEILNKTASGVRTPSGDQVIDIIASEVNKATGQDVVTARVAVQNIFRQLTDYDIIGIYFIIGKLIGDLLCTLCSDNKWYTVTNDNLLIARCLILLKRALLFHNSKAFSGFYFFRPQLQENNPVRTQEVENKRQQNIQTLTTRINHSDMRSNSFIILAGNSIKKINADVDRRIRLLSRKNLDHSIENKINLARKHKLYCKNKIEETLEGFMQWDERKACRYDPIPRRELAGPGFHRGEARLPQRRTPGTGGGRRRRLRPPRPCPVAP
jgi:hypothetical protein